MLRDDYGTQTTFLSYKLDSTAFRDIIYGLLTASEMPEHITAIFRTPSASENTHHPVDPASYGSHLKTPVFEYYASQDLTTFVGSPYLEGLCPKRPLTGVIEPNNTGPPPALSAPFWMEFDSSSMDPSIAQSWDSQRDILTRTNNPEKEFELWSAAANGSEWVLVSSRDLQLTRFVDWKIGNGTFIVLTRWSRVCRVMVVPIYSEKMSCDSRQSKFFS